MNTEFLHVTAAEYISGYLLKLTFSNGEVRSLDFSSIYDKGIFATILLTAGLSIGITRQPGAAWKNRKRNALIPHSLPGRSLSDGGE